MQETVEGLLLISPLKADFGPCGLPPLLKINSKEIETRVFTHRSFSTLPSIVFEDTSDDPDDELLEHVSDQVLGLIVTDLLQREYPNLRSEPFTAIRVQVVSNNTLATIAVQYKLPDRLRTQCTYLKTSTHVQVDVFESYVGGLYQDQGLTAVKVWLDQLFTPYVHKAYRVVRELHGQLVGFNNGPDAAHAAHTPLRSQFSPNYLSQFNMNLQQYNRRVEWKFDHTVIENNVPLWDVKLVVDGDRWGNGRGNTKKLAKNKASKHGLWLMAWEGRTLRISEG